MTWLDSNDARPASPNLFQRLTRRRRPHWRGAVNLSLAGGLLFTLATCQPPPPSSPPPGSPTGHFSTLPPGSALPSGAECASRVRPTAEIKPENAVANATRGSGPNARYPRVDGAFNGSTDEILQWVACKWGVDEDLVRAQVAVESWWQQSTLGAETWETDHCYPPLRKSGSCSEHVGLMQVGYYWHTEAFQDGNALRSSAYNVDYAYAVWRECFEGGITYLNPWEKSVPYVAGDPWGCVGRWFAGWYTPESRGYIDRVQGWMNEKIWTQPHFSGW